MKENRLFDRYQLILIIAAIAMLTTSFIVFVPMYLTATVQYDEAGVVETIVYNRVLQGLYGAFFLLHLIALLWFILRLATFKLRKKEEANE